MLKRIVSESPASILSGRSSGGSSGSRRVAAVSTAALCLLTVAACGRSGPTGTPSQKASSSSSASASPAGTFGSLQKICGPGSGKGGSGRGISDGSVRIGVINDAGNSISPALGKEFVEVATGFSKWCNAAGGINGRKIVIENLDAKIFNVAAVTIQGCQGDFMLVGGGNPLDAGAVKPRLNCKLGQIPAYTVSPQAGAAGLQVNPAVNPITEYQIGVLRLLADAYPASKEGLAVGASNLQSLAPQGLRAADAWKSLGYKLTTLQPRPLTVTNYRPYVEEMKTNHAMADYESTSQDLVQIVTAMNDVGYKPAFLGLNVALYGPSSVAAAKTVQVPPSYVGLNHIPWELSGQYPVVQEAKAMLEAAVSNPTYDDIGMQAFNAWTLWASSATACGDNLTQDCVLQKAGAHSDWTAGGLFSPRSTDPATQKATNCVAIVRLTGTGWVYDRDVTKPNSSIYNCDPRNIATVKSYQS
jgi:ABC-type branched-subunit amino acid transport system substrate-binding protein